MPKSAKEYDEFVVSHAGLGILVDMCLDAHVVAPSHPPSFLSTTFLPCELLLNCQYLFSKGHGIRFRNLPAS